MAFVGYPHADIPAGKTAPWICKAVPVLWTRMQIQELSTFKQKVNTGVENNSLRLLGCHNKVPQTEWLRQQKCIVSRFWRLDIQDQGISRTMIHLTVPGKNLFQDSLLASGSSLACVVPWLVAS